MNELLERTKEAVSLYLENNYLKYKPIKRD